MLRSSRGLRALAAWACHVAPGLPFAVAVAQTPPPARAPAEPAPAPAPAPVLAPMPADFADRAAWQSDEIGVGVQLRFRWFERLYAGPQSLTVVEVAPQAKARYDVVAPGVRTKTSAMGAQNGALAAINGGFFAIESTGLSTGLLRLDGALVVPAKPAQASLGIGSDHRLRVATRPEGDWPEVEDALGAGPMLLRDGAVVDHGARQRRIRHPRSAIGVGKDGSVVWLTADGRTDKAAGLAHEETAAILQALGCVDAVNLDGGGSTTLWVAGRGVVNHPCDNKKYDHAGERAVANAVLLRAPAVVVVDDAQATLRGDGWTRVPRARANVGGVGAGYARWVGARPQGEVPGGAAPVGNVGSGRAGVDQAGADAARAAETAPCAEFAVELPVAGAWQVSASWPTDGGEAGAWQFEVAVVTAPPARGDDRGAVAAGAAAASHAAATPGTPRAGALRTVRGRRGAWAPVGTVDVEAGQRAVVRVVVSGDQAVVLDALRWEQVAR
ncbi:MAG: phosphodiester glycosidase family protein [Planctomycetota bacterium]